MLYYLTWRFNQYSDNFLDIIRISQQKEAKQKYEISKKKYYLNDNIDLVNYDVELIKSTRITTNKIKDIIYYVMFEKNDITNNIKDCKICVIASKSLLTSEIKLFLRDYKYNNYDIYNYDFDKIEKLIDIDIKQIKKNRKHNFENYNPDINYTTNYTIKIDEKDVVFE